MMECLTPHRADLGDSRSLEGHTPYLAQPGDDGRGNTKTAT